MTFCRIFNFFVFYKYYENIISIFEISEECVYGGDGGEGLVLVCNFIKKRPFNYSSNFYIE